MIIDHVITNERAYELPLSAAEGPSVLTVLVSCGIEVLRKREKARGNRYQGAAEVTMQYLYPKDGYDLTIDTGVLSSEQAAEMIIARALQM